MHAVSELARAHQRGDGPGWAEAQRGGTHEGARELQYAPSLSREAGRVLYFAPRQHDACIVAQVQGQASPFSFAFGIFAEMSYALS